MHKLNVVFVLWDNLRSGISIDPICLFIPSRSHLLEGSETQTKRTLTRRKMATVLISTFILLPGAMVDGNGLADCTLFIFGKWHCIFVNSRFTECVWRFLLCLKWPPGFACQLDTISSAPCIWESLCVFVLFFLLSQILALIQKCPL